jgi:hypothetical protein
MHVRTRNNLIEFARLYKSRIPSREEQVRYEDLYDKALRYFGIGRRESNAGNVYSMVKRELAAEGVDIPALKNGR